jgi:hypothetical protein
MGVNNPAGRLLSVLNVLRNAGNVSAIQAWSAALNVSPNDKLRVLERFGRAAMLAHRAKDAVLQVENVTHERFLRWVPAVEHAFSLQSLNGAVSVFTSQLNETVLYSLEMCDELLSRTLPEKVLANDDLKALRKDFEELKVELANAEVSTSLKHYVSDHLNEILAALADYDIAGIEPFERALENVVGSVILKFEVFDKVTKTTVGKRFWTVVQRALLTVSVLHGGAQLPTDFEKLHQLLLNHSAVESVEKKDRPDVIGPDSIIEVTESDGGFSRQKPSS